jgi:nitronate monooxygenase
MAMVTTVSDARAIAEAGVDMVVAQGAEPGGHRSNWSEGAEEAATMVIVPRIVDVVKQPVIAAGGVVNGSGLVAALALGAAGVMLGTRFIATRESIAPSFFKDAVVSAKCQRHHRQPRIHRASEANEIVREFTPAD